MKLFVIFISILFSLNQVFSSTKLGLINNKGVNIYSSYTTNSESTGKPYYNEMILILDKTISNFNIGDDSFPWYYIERDYHKFGWVYGKHLIELDKNEYIETDIYYSNIILNILKNEIKIKNISLLSLNINIDRKNRLVILQFCMPSTGECSISGSYVFKITSGHLKLILKDSHIQSQYYVISNYLISFEPDDVNVYNMDIIHVIDDRNTPDFGNKKDVYIQPYDLKLFDSVMNTANYYSLFTNTFKFRHGSDNESNNRSDLFMKPNKSKLILNKDYSLLLITENTLSSNVITNKYHFFNGVYIN